jgi:hypothetical protein
MEQSKSLDLYYFNVKEIKPIIFIITRINSEIEEKILDSHADFLFNSLIENKFAEESDILIFNLIKEYQGKIINWILPSKKSNKNILEKIENNKDIINNIIITTLKKTNCNTLISISNDELKIKDCDLDLEMFSEIYF